MKKAFSQKKNKNKQTKIKRKQKHSKTQLDEKKLAFS